MKKIWTISNFAQKTLKKITLWVMLSCFFTPLSNGVLQAQNAYSYVSDRSFKQITDIIGWQFAPSQEEVKGNYKRNLNAGDVAFGVTMNNLYVTGKNIQGVYSINNMVPTNFGFQLQLMNANNPTLQGHLKIILDNNRQAYGLLFKRSPKDPEILYELPDIPKHIEEREKEYFSDKNEVIVPHIDSLWTKGFRPFYSFNGDNRIQRRIQISDDVFFTFSMKTTIIDKTKKKDKDKTPTAVTDTVKTNDPSKIKIVKEYFLKVHFKNKLQNNEIEEKTVDYTFEKFDWKEDSRAPANAPDRFRITLKPKNGAEMAIYLNANKAISFIDMDGFRYAVRGF
jgi:hypothetical protein